MTELSFLDHERKAGGRAGIRFSVQDSTYEFISRLLRKRIDGFGKFFRSLSFWETSTSAMLIRSVRGTVVTTVRFSLSGPLHAVKLGMTMLILPQAGHLVRNFHRHNANEASG